jgi:Family of unknown function (DUF716)
MFFLSGVVDLAVWCCPVRQSVAVADFRPPCVRHVRLCSLTAPPRVDFLALSLGFIGEMLMFSQHTHGKTEFDKLLHYLLLYVLASTVMSVLAEGVYRLSLANALTTTYLLFVQGTWFIQVRQVFSITLFIYSPEPQLYNIGSLTLFDDRLVYKEPHQKAPSNMRSSI